MAFGFPAQHTEEFSAPASDFQFRARVAQQLNALGWPLYSQSFDRVELGTLAGMASWGENVTCEFISPDRMRVTSKCKMATQCFDWGKNRKNVQKVRETLGL